MLAFCRKLGAIYNARFLKVQVIACIGIYTYMLGTVTLTDCQGDRRVCGGRGGGGKDLYLLLYLLVLIVGVSYIVY